MTSSEQTPQTVMTYRPTEAQARFMLSERDKVLIVGPPGSGKSVTLAMIVSMIANQIDPCKDGVRRCRLLAMRNTVTDLRDTTVNTFKDWYHEGFDIKWTDHPKPKLHIKNDEIDCEVLFRGLDGADGIKGLLSLEVTAALCNETRELPYDMIDTLYGRCGRYPPASMRPDDAGPDWPASRLPGKKANRIYADTNAPAMGSAWAAIIAGKDPDDPTRDKDLGWEVIIQPPAVIKTELEDGKVEWRVNPNADNLKNLPKDYYTGQLSSKESYIRQMLAIEIIEADNNRLVHGELFNKRIHVVKMNPNPDKIIIGMDFGRTPAAVFGYLTPRGRLVVFDEMYGDNIGLNEFVNWDLLPHIMNRYKGIPISVVGDPAGIARMQGYDKSLFDILADAGFAAQPASTNKPEARIAEVDSFLSTLVGGEPRLTFVEGSTPRIVECLETGYKYKVDKYGNIGDPIKDKYSHPADALQYLVLGCSMRLAYNQRNTTSRGRVNHPW